MRLVCVAGARPTFMEVKPVMDALCSPPTSGRAGSWTSSRFATGLMVIEPLGYLDFLALEAGARVVITDSGGVQEETTVLGVPCLTLRDNTERPITVTEGTNVVVGRDPERILSEARRVLAQGVEVRRPALWDGRAGERIAEVLLSGGTVVTRLRPTDLS